MSVALIQESYVGGYTERVFPQSEVVEKLAWQRVFYNVRLHITPPNTSSAPELPLLRTSCIINQFSAYVRI